MANRHLSRSIVMQSLFEWDFAHKTDEEALDIVERNADEFAPGMGEHSFMKKLAQSILKKRKDIDTIIEKAAPDWPLDKISVVDRNILRIGLYELLFADRKEVPAKVAINEAIELAKTYGGETSGKFVNGVLGAVYKEMGEPGKDEISQREKKKKFNRTFEEMPIERLGGAVIYAKDKKDIYFALVHDVFGHWTLSKGHVSETEDEAKGTEREIKDELGIDIKVGVKLGMNEYVATHPEDGKVRKQVSYFIAETKYQDLHLSNTGGLDDARWFKINEILNLNFYNDILPIVTSAVKMLLGQDTPKE
jgi:N utilization substance protein B